MKKQKSDAFAKKQFAHALCNLKYSINKEIHVFLHNCKNYDYYFIIK